MNFRQIGFGVSALGFGIAQTFFGNAIGIIGGDFNSTDAYSALVNSNATVSPLSPLPTMGSSIYWVSMNQLGESLIGGLNGSDAYAAFVSPDGALSPVSPLPAGQIWSVAINNSGNGLIGGYQTVGLNTPSYAATVSSGGVVTELPIFFSNNSIFFSVDYNDAGVGIIAGKDYANGDPLSVLVFPGGGYMILPPVANPALYNTGTINQAGFGIVGGIGNTQTVGARFSPGGDITPLSPLPAVGSILYADINESGVGLIGGFSNDTFPGLRDVYAAYVSTDGTVTPLSLAALPAKGLIYSVDLNNSGEGIIGGLDEVGLGAIAALVSVNGTVRPLSSPELPLNGIVYDVAINEAGAGLIGGADFGNSVGFAALVAPNGTLTFLDLLNPTTYIFSVAILDEVVPATIGPYTSPINSVLAASNSLEAHIMVHHKQPWLRERSSDHMNLAMLLVDADWESNSSGGCVPCVDPCAPQTDFTFFVIPFYDFIKEKGQMDVPGFTNEIGGAIVALDYKGIRDVVLGGGLCYDFNYVSYSESLGHAKIHQEMAVLYSSFQWKRLFFNATVWGGIYQLDNLRRTPELSIASTLKTTGWTLTPHVEATLFFECGNNWLVVEPFAMFDWVNDWQKHGTEKGASGFNLVIDHRYASLLRSEAGLRLYETFRFQWGRILIEEKGSYINKMPFDFNPASTFFVGGLSSFSVSTGTNKTQNLGGVQLHASFLPWNEKYPYGSIDAKGEFGSKYQSYFAALEIGQRF